MADERDDDLEEQVDELRRELSTLRDRLEGEMRPPPTGPLGLPRPPTPGELIRFADEFAIPAAIAVLEANIKALELVRGALHLLDPDRGAVEGTRARRRAESVGKSALTRLDRTVEDLQRALDEGTLPRDENAREIVEDARRLRGEIADRIDGSRNGERTAREEGSERSERTDTERTEPDREGTPIEIDVDEEIDSIKAELEGGDLEEGGDEAGGEERAEEGGRAEEDDADDDADRD
ncbi:DUF7547 family protein [Natronorarus salvus]|uniref:DUF7547 family protein n=1 Tax=Natronorarus salvus TaxID=3117733 RepID=UPI002F268D83